jgi:hypothetical protein
VTTAAHRLAIRGLLEGPLTAEALDTFLGAHSFPLVEGSSVTFVWRGEADAVRLRHFIYGLPASQPFTRAPGTDLWHLTLDLPERSRVEYKFEVDKGGEARWVEDPLNRLHARDPFGANSVVHAHGYEVPEWTRFDPESRAGTIEEHVLESSALGREARVGVYLPARFRPRRRYPLLLVHDGGDYLAYSGLKTVLDNLIHRVEVSDLIVALTYPGDRLVEYADHEPHARFLTDELVPVARAALAPARPAVGALPDGRIVRRGRLALDGGPLSRGLRTAAAAIRLVRVQRHRPEPAWPGVRRDRPVRQCLPRPAVQGERARVPELRDVRVAHLREPLARAPAAIDRHGRALRRGARRPQLGELAGPLRGGLAWLFPGPIGMIYE